MENAFFIFMLIFAGAILLYGFLLFVTRDPLMIPKRFATRPVDEDERNYARQLGKASMLMAAAPAASGITGLLAGNTAGIIVLAVCFILCLWASVCIMKKVLDTSVIDEDEEIEEEDI